MTIDPRLGDLAPEHDFARMVNRSRRTVARWRAQAGGLPFVKLGSEVLIPIPEAKAWIASRIRHPNPRRRK